MRPTYTRIERALSESMTPDGPRGLREALHRLEDPEVTRRANEELRATFVAFRLNVLEAPGFIGIGVDPIARDPNHPLSIPPAEDPKLQPDDVDDATIVDPVSIVAVGSGAHHEDGAARARPLADHDLLETGKGSHHHRDFRSGGLALPPIEVPA
jgi:hypothetical protein